LAFMEPPTFSFSSSSMLGLTAWRTGKAWRCSTVSSDAPDRLAVEGVSAAEIGRIAATHGVELHELVPVAPSLEEAFMTLTADAVAFHGSSDTSKAA